MNPRHLMSDETLQSAQRAIATALRHLKELEEPSVRLPEGPAGGDHRESALEHLRAALLEVSEALAFHRRAGTVGWTTPPPSPQPVPGRLASGASSDKGIPTMFPSRGAKTGFSK